MPSDSRPSADELMERTALREAHLYETDQQFRKAAPLHAVSEVIRQPGLPLMDLVATIMEGYAGRPALAERAMEPVFDKTTGRTSLRRLDRFDTITYRELWERAGSVAAEWRFRPGSSLSAGDFVAILGPTCADYAVLDLACLRAGAVSVPLQAGATVEHLAPIVAQTEARILAVHVDHLEVAAEIASRADSLRRLVVFGYRPEVTAQREMVDSVRERIALGNEDLAVDPLTSVIEGGRGLPPVPRAESEVTREALSWLIYTSGSTGAPKGAMYTERIVAQYWVDLLPRKDVPNIVLNYLPLSHMMGRAVLFGTLAKGGTAYFTASSDLSTFFEDLALVRPTELVLVPRVCDLLFQRYHSQVAALVGPGGERTEHETQVKQELREQVLGGRLLWLACGSAPFTEEMTAFVESCAQVRLLDGYGSTEAGLVMYDGHLLHPRVTDYKLVDVPELGYFSTDTPYPRGELLLKAESLISGYFHQPEATAQVFDEDGFYRTGDVMAETGPDELTYVDRRSNVLKLSQGEFVAVSGLEAVFTTGPFIRQIFVYGNSARAYLLAVVVPTQDALERAGNDDQRLRLILRESLRSLGNEAGLNSYEVPRDFLIEMVPFSHENGLLSGLRKLLRPALTKHYGDRLEALYTELTEREANELDALRKADPTLSVLESVLRAARALLGNLPGDLDPATHFVELGGDSLSAVSFSVLLREIFGLDVPVNVVISPANNLQGVAAYIQEALDSGQNRPTASAVHGAGATRLLARDLSLERFIDVETLAKAEPLAGPLPEPRTVLLTGANGYLGRFLCLEWLERVAARGGTLVCVVRGGTTESARARLDEVFDSGDPELLRRYRDLSAEYLQVVAGDIGEQALGLDEKTWRRLADTVDLIVHPAALVNHVLPYDQLFGPNVAGTAELIKLAITSRMKQFTYLSSIAVTVGHGEAGDEAADIRETLGARVLDTGYASGYGASKWAGEVLLREANDRFGLPVATFRSNLILAHPRYRGQVNIPDMFTRFVFSLLVTGIAPGSFYTAGARAHYDGLPVDFTAEVIASLGDSAREGYRTFNVVNPHDDGISLDTVVDWLREAGHPIRCIDDYKEWFVRFETVLRGLPDRSRQHSLLPLLHAFSEPESPVPGSALPAGHFRAAVRAAALGEDHDIPHLTPALIGKYVADLRLEHLL
ncbi:carboxylic acid reductase [Streptomyces sp. 049-1]|uniref:carboxylic acid reductase n=1 Tax=Streptomyces sp. 049-1 TaxID=2789264 RepID=UPI003980F352